jgi:hypothetical protein
VQYRRLWCGDLGTVTGPRTWCRRLIDLSAHRSQRSRQISNGPAITPAPRPNAVSSSPVFEPMASRTPDRASLRVDICAQSPLLNLIVALLAAACARGAPSTATPTSTTAVGPSSATVTRDAPPRSHHPLRTPTLQSPGVGRDNASSPIRTPSVPLQDVPERITRTSANGTYQMVGVLPAHTSCSPGPPISCRQS